MIHLHRSEVLIDRLRPSYTKAAASLALIG